MPKTLAIDVYGTLIDPQAIAKSLQALADDKAGALATLWREKQLEYSFRRGLMGVYQDFRIVTRNALEYACATLAVDLTEADKLDLMAQYRKLDAFADTVPALTALRGAGHRLFAFSNGVPEDIASLMDHAQISHLLEGVVSVHDTHSFKPDPKVYKHFNDTTGTAAGQTWLVSSNPFDVIGARAFGWKAAWIQRAKTTIFDPWEFEPTAIVSSLEDLKQLLENQAL